MKVLMVEPGKVPYSMEIEPGLDGLMAAIGGDIEHTFPFEDLVGIIYDMDCLNKGLPPNRVLRDETGAIYDILHGKFLVVGLGDQDFTGLSDNLMQKFFNRFKYPEDFYRLAGQIVVIPKHIPDEVKKAKMPPSQER